MPSCWGQKPQRFVGLGRSGAHELRWGTCELTELVARLTPPRRGASLGKRKTRGSSLAFLCIFWNAFKAPTRQVFLKSFEVPKDMKLKNCRPKAPLQSFDPLAGKEHFFEFWMWMSNRLTYERHIDFHDRMANGTETFPISRYPCSISASEFVRNTSSWINGQHRLEAVDNSHSCRAVSSLHPVVCRVIQTKKKVKLDSQKSW